MLFEVSGIRTIRKGVWLELPICSLGTGISRKLHDPTQVSRNEPRCHQAVTARILCWSSDAGLFPEESVAISICNTSSVPTVVKRSLFAFAACLITPFYNLASLRFLPLPLSTACRQSWRTTLPPAAAPPSSALCHSVRSLVPPAFETPTKQSNPST